MMDKLKSLFNTEQMMMDAVKGFLPQIKSIADKYNKPKAEGGLLEGDEKQAVIMINFSSDEMEVVVALLKIVDGNTVISRAVAIEELQKK